MWSDLQFGVRSDFVLHEGFIFFGARLCIPNCSLRLKLIQELHGEGYVGGDRTLQLIVDAFFWLTLHRAVARFVERYTTCQKSKGRAFNRG